MKTTLTLVALFACYITWAQVTEEQVRPVDSLLAHAFLDSPTFHSMSVLSPGLYIWTAGSGLHDGRFINWTHEGKVHPDTIGLANSLPDQYLGSFNLDAYDDATHYQQAVEDWLFELDLPVGIRAANNNVAIRVYPNPTRGYAFLEVKMNTGEDYQISVFDSWGRKVMEYQGTSIKKGFIFELDLGEHKYGLYIIDFKSKGIHYRSKVLKE